VTDRLIKITTALAVMAVAAVAAIISYRKRGAVDDWPRTLQVG
jgi:hypothetical protein